MVCLSSEFSVQELKKHSSAAQLSKIIDIGKISDIKPLAPFMIIYNKWVNQLNIVLFSSLITFNLKGSPKILFIHFPELVYLRKSLDFLG